MSLNYARRGFLVWLAGTVAAGLATAAHADGIAFFENAERPGPDPLLYFGHVKDEDGNYLAQAMIYVVIPSLGVTLQRITGPDGHYRSHDIVKALREIGEDVDASEIEIYCAKPGYRQVRPTRRTVPDKNRGRFEIDFVLAKQ
jgi:hypothetical protein